MKKLECIFRNEKLETVKDELSACGIQGMTVTHVIGCGLQQGRTEFYRGTEYSVNLLPKVKVEIVLQDKDVDAICNIIRRAAFTGSIGDGKIFIYNVEDAIRIRTGERGESAI